LRNHYFVLGKLLAAANNIHHNKRPVVRPFRSILLSAWDWVQPTPAKQPLGIAAGLGMLFRRYLPIVAPMAVAAYLGARKKSPVGLGTLRDDTAMFGFLLLATVLIIGVLLFLPAAPLGPVAELQGPFPFGGLADRA